MNNLECRYTAKEDSGLDEQRSGLRNAAAEDNAAEGRNHNKENGSAENFSEQNNGSGAENGPVRRSGEKKSQDTSKEEKDEKRDQKILDYGQVTLDENSDKHRIHLLSIIGEIEGHECLSPNQKTTKYDHVLPQLAAIEDSSEVDGLLVLLNTVGGDVESGLAIAEMIASLSKPSVSLVLGGGHSIGVPLAVATDYSFIVPSGTMIIHPVRMSGTIIGAKQTYDYFKRIQDRILDFTVGHSKAEKDEMEKMMMNTGMLSKDLGTILVGQEAVDCGLIDAVGGIKEAMEKLHEMIQGTKKEKRLA